MTKKILCKKLNEELPALKIPPMPGPKGLELMESISEKAWDQWRSHQTTLIKISHLILGCLKHPTKYVVQFAQLGLSL